MLCCTLLSLLGSSGIGIVERQIVRIRHLSCKLVSQIGIFVPAKAGAKDIAIGVASGGQVAFCTKFTK